MSIESDVAARLVHQERIARILERTGGETIHPRLYDLREALRTSVLAAIDQTTAEVEAPRMRDGELPDLFKTLDGISERLFLIWMGL